MTATTGTPPTSLADGRYVLDDLLGRGGLALTHRAHDRRLDRWVAVKSLVPDPAPDVAAVQRTRFVREARALARFDHLGIVRVYEVFEEGGTAHLVMEYLHGRSVAAELLARGTPLTADEAMTLASGVGRALAAVHVAGLLHRDVSPSNVVLVDDDRGRRPVLIDFGLARDVGDLTDGLTRMVTPGFAPPEQYGGDPARVGPPTDVYGLAATLYHACASRLPASAVDRQHGAALVPLRRIRPDLPREFCDGVHDGLELDPSHRPAEVSAFLARLGLAEEIPLTVGVTVAPTAAAAPAERQAIARPAARDRGWTSVVPPVLLAAAVGVAAPLAGVAALIALALPAVATVGDRMRGRRRLAVPWRFARNVATSVGACWPALLVALAGSTAALVIDRVSASTSLDDVMAAATGGGAALLALRLAGPDREAMAAWRRHCRDGVLYAAWTVALLAACGALALRPDLWPLSSP